MPSFCVYSPPSNYTMHKDDMSDTPPRLLPIPIQAEGRFSDDNPLKPAEIE